VNYELGLKNIELC